jgi:hypothetical protein
MTAQDKLVQTLAKPATSFNGTGCKAETEDAPQGVSEKRAVTFSLSAEARALPLYRPTKGISRFTEVWR